MSYRIPGLIQEYKYDSAAVADLPPYRFVKFKAGSVDELELATDASAGAFAVYGGGVTKAGGCVEVQMDKVVLVQAGVAIAQGDLVIPGVDGKAELGAPTSFAGGVALNDAAIDEQVAVFIG